MRRQLVPAVVAFLVFTVLVGLVYPLVVTGVAQVAFPGRADGSLVERDGTVVGSKLIGQIFTGPGVLPPAAPRAAGDGYDAMSSSASNLGPNNPDLARRGRGTAPGLPRGERAERGRRHPGGRGHRLGLGPRSAHLGRRRAASGPARRRRTGPEPRRGLALVDDHTQGRSLGFLGEPRRQRARAEPRPRPRGVAFPHGARNAPHLPRRRAGRRQDLRHARRRPPPPRARHRRRRRPRRVARPRARRRR